MLFANCTSRVFRAAVLATALVACPSWLTAGEAPADLAAELTPLASILTGRTQQYELTGRVEVEQLLDVIFGDFCIGK